LARRTQQILRSSDNSTRRGDVHTPLPKRVGHVTASRRLQAVRALRAPRIRPLGFAVGIGFVPITPGQEMPEPQGAGSSEARGRGGAGGFGRIDRRAVSEAGRWAWAFWKGGLRFGRSPRGGDGPKAPGDEAGRDQTMPIVAGFSPGSQIVQAPPRPTFRRLFHKEHTVLCGAGVERAVSGERRTRVEDRCVVTSVNR